MISQRHRGLGWFLVIIGVIGVLTGAVPLTTNGLRILVDPDLWNVVDLASHGVEAMGLSVEWGFLSSAMGTVLGVVLLWAGVCWLRGYPCARRVTWNYVLVGLTVNVVDMIIFAFRAKHGPMRTQMLFADGIAMLIPIVLGVWLIRQVRGASASAASGR